MDETQILELLRELDDEERYIRLTMAPLSKRQEQVWYHPNPANPNEYFEIERELVQLRRDMRAVDARRKAL